MFWFKKKNLMVESIIGKNMLVHGSCDFEGSLQINGCVLGHIHPKNELGSLIAIGKDGSVQGNINASEIIIAGSVIGDVIAKEKVILTESARIQGNVEYKSIEMAEGALIAGKLIPQISTTSAVNTQVKANNEQSINTQPVEPTL